MNRRSLRIFSSLILCGCICTWAQMAQAKCDYGPSYTDGLKIAIIGDSFFTTFGEEVSMDKDISALYGGFSQTIRSHIRTTFVRNNAQAGARFLGYFPRSIRKQDIPEDAEVLIIGGGLNDILACNWESGDIGCHKKVIHRIVFPTLDKGRLTKTIDTKVPSDTLIYIIYLTNYPNVPGLSGALSTFRELFKNAEVGENLGRRYMEFAATNERITWINAGNFIDVEDKAHFLSDGIHLSLAGYELIVKAIAQDLESKSVQ
jgi:hypothetical protein